MKIFGFAGYSGSGKTTLIEKLIPIFTARGLSVSLIKHAHHTFDVDQPGRRKQVDEVASAKHREPDGACAGGHEIPQRRRFTTASFRAPLRSHK